MFSDGVFAAKGGSVPMKRLLSLALLAVMLLGACLPAQAEKPALTREQLLSYYDGALFVGDSITAQLLVYVREQQKADPSFLENVKFLTAQSYMLYTASRKNLLSGKANVKYRGKELPLCQALQQIKPTKALILLGMNDYIGETIEKGIGYDERLLMLAAEYAPDTEIIFQSLTPVTPAFGHKKDYRTLWDEYNQALEKMCLEKNVGYVDIASPLKDEEGYLDKALSSDGKCHLNPKGLAKWIQALADYAQAQYEQGLWAPKED